MDETVLVCEDSLEGIFTAVYQVYAWKLNREAVFLQPGEEGNLRLFAQYRHVEPMAELAVKVARTVLQRMGEDAYWEICCMLSSQDADKAQAVYRVIKTGLDKNQGKEVFSNVKDSYIQKGFELARAAGNEIHHLYGFLRFQELENGILYAKIGPKNNIVTLLAPHFADRFPEENFIIHDDKREIFVIHEAHKNWVVFDGTEIGNYSLPGNSKQEERFQSLFVRFCHTIAIKERKNLALQRNMLPLRFQEYMVEFANK